MPKPSSGANRVSVSHSSLVTKNGEHSYGEIFIHDFPKSWKHIKEVDWGDKLKLNYTTYGYMLMEIDWGGTFNYTSCEYPIANWQGHEKHPTGHKTSEVYWGGHDPNGSDNPPPMPIINLDDLLGSIFLLPMDENGERKRATISEHVKGQVRFKLKIDGDQLDDLYPNHVNESLLSEVDWGAHNPDADDPRTTHWRVNSVLCHLCSSTTMVSNSGEPCHPCTSHYLVQACGGIILISRPTFMDIYPYFQDNT